MNFQLGYFAVTGEPSFDFFFSLVFWFGTAAFVFALIVRVIMES